MQGTKPLHGKASRRSLLLLEGGEFGLQCGQFTCVPYLMFATFLFLKGKGILLLEYKR
jgi:hypothetical protein